LDTYWPPWMGAGLYRPLTISAFTLQWAVGRGAPWIFHATNITAYIIVCVLVLALARLMLPPAAAWTAAALFAVDPLHVEAVGNVVGQSELWAACGVLGAVVCFVRWRDAAARMRLEPTTPVGGLPGRAVQASAPGSFAAVGGPIHAGVLGAFIALACMAKEHAVVAPALIAAAELWVVSDPRPMRERWRAVRP